MNQPCVQGRREEEHVCLIFRVSETATSFWNVVVVVVIVVVMWLIVNIAFFSENVPRAGREKNAFQSKEARLGNRYVRARVYHGYAYLGNLFCSERPTTHYFRHDSFPHGFFSLLGYI